MYEEEASNIVSVTGKVISDIIYSHEIRRERFYLTYISVARLSGREDILPVMIPGHLIDSSKDLRGTLIEVTGQFRSYRRNDDHHNMLSLIIFASEINVCDDPGSFISSNEIYLNGTTCRQVTYRRTPKGRGIADVFLSVRRMHGRCCDHIPCIAWGENAKLLSALSGCTRIKLWGRIQSREYMKRLNEGEPVIRMAYEVSINDFQLLGSEYEDAGINPS